MSQKQKVIKTTANKVLTVLKEARTIPTLPPVKAKSISPAKGPEKKSKDSKLSK